MEDSVETNAESRKEWTAPELKKIDLEEITAAGGAPTGDSLNAGS
jgi:hypothetical protein